MSRLARTTFLGVVLVAGAALAQGQIIIINGDPPGQGFNDPTPAVPIGGNTGTTLGEQRLQVFETAAGIWEATLHPKLDIRVLATFEPLPPNVLGSAGTLFIYADFPGAELPGTWYHVALANQLSGVDLAAVETGDPNVPHIRARFTTQFPFYFGLDNNELPGTTDLLVVLLHEIGHGLGFANFANEQTGALTLDTPDIYSQYTLDVTTGKVWNQMTDQERAASAIRVGLVSWSGVNTAKDTPKVLQLGDPTVIISSPSGLGPFVAGTASFGPALTPGGTSAQVVQALDPAIPVTSPTTTDACSALTNAAAVAGKIAFLDRGTCAFTQKVLNAQNAGAIGVIVRDNAAGDPPAGLGGTDPTITIPSVRVSITAGNQIRTALGSGPVTATLKLDTSRRAGTDSVLGLMRLAALNPVALGSSISHVDSTAFPNQLMEPAINADLTKVVVPPADLTTSVFTDEGWFSDQDGVPDGVDQCIGSPRADPVEIGACVTKARNLVFFNGCRIADLVNDCGQPGPGFTECVRALSDQLYAANVLSKREAQSLWQCAKAESRN